MDKEKLIKLAEDLYQSAFDANAYYAIMMQYRDCLLYTSFPKQGLSVYLSEVTSRKRNPMTASMM